jgi:tRNA dimethylallyltransferase
VKRIITVVGPTAVGKSRLALQLAWKFNGEVINADSRQVYRYMDIGTAKPGRAERSLIPHYLLDIINPNESFSLALYQELAVEAIDNISNRGKTPFLVGGSGLYVWSIVEGWQIPQVPPDAEFRRRLEVRAKAEGSRILYEELQQIDPVAAAKILPDNIRRIIRALEVYKATGKPASKLWQKQAPPFAVLIVGLTTKRDDLYHSIDSRVETMIKQGLVDEVKDLMARGYSLNLPSLSSIGYRQIGMVLQGKLDMLLAIQQMKYETHRFARHQYAWFRLNDDRIHWFDISDDNQENIDALVQAFLTDSKDE